MVINQTQSRCDDCDKDGRHVTALERMGVSCGVRPRPLRTLLLGSAPCSPGGEPTSRADWRCRSSGAVEN